MDTRPLGCDISHNNSTFDIVKSAFDFIICKATQNETFRDPVFNTNWQILKHGTNKVRGCYHFFGLGEARIQAENYLSRGVDFGAPGCLPPILDIEDLVGKDAADSLRLNKQVLANRSNWIESALEWLSIVEEKTGRTPIIYSYANYFAEYLNNDQRFTRFPLWIASYQNHEPGLPKGFDRYTFWQYSQYGGPNKDLDLDLFNGTFDELKSLANAAP